MIIYIATAVILIVMISIITEEYRSHHCKVCGTRMCRYYDTEEDAEVYQCPKCGRSYLIK